MVSESYVRLGVNIDHVATIRNARGSMYPDPVEAAILAQNEGADGITAHLREDRRHIRDEDIDGLIAALNIPLNFEMAATEEMQKIALKHKPHAVCLVPEKREERREKTVCFAVLETRTGEDHLKYKKTKQRLQV